MAENEAKETPQQPSGFRHSEDFYDDYANHVYLESSVWDLKLIFGQLDQSTTPITTEQHTAITIPWTQAKILTYLLAVHILGYELANGTIAIPDSIMPPELPPPTEEQKNADPNLPKFFDEMRKLREQILGAKPPSA